MKSDLIDPDLRVPGAPSEITRTIDASSYTFDYGFDADGRLSLLTYPENVHQQRLAVEYVYDPSGPLSQVRNAATPSLVYYSWPAR